MRVVVRVIVLLWAEREDGVYEACCCNCCTWLALASLEIRVMEEDGMLAVEISDRGGRIRFEDRVCFCRAEGEEEEEEDEGEGWRGNGDTSW